MKKGESEQPIEVVWNGRVGMLCSRIWAGYNDLPLSLVGQDGFGSRFVRATRISYCPKSQDPAPEGRGHAEQNSFLRLHANDCKYCLKLQGSQGVPSSGVLFPKNHILLILAESPA